MSVQWCHATKITKRRSVAEKILRRGEVCVEVEEKGFILGFHVRRSVFIYAEATARHSGAERGVRFATRRLYRRCVGGWASGDHPKLMNEKCFVFLWE
jgi:hypothetical protein